MRPREFHERAAARKGAREDELKRMVRMVAMGGPAMELLTGKPEWDQFLQLLQTRCDEARAEIASWRKQFEETTDLSHENLIKLKLGFTAAHNRLAALEFAMGLPKELMANAKRVTE